MTQDDVVVMAVNAGANAHFVKHHIAFIEKLAKLVAEAEREACAKMLEDAPALVVFAQNDQGGCLMCGFTPKLAAKTIRARGQA